MSYPARAEGLVNSTYCIVVNKTLCSLTEFVRFSTFYNGVQCNFGTTMVQLEGIQRRVIKLIKGVKDFSSRERERERERD